MKLDYRFKNKITLMWAAVQSQRYGFTIVIAKNKTVQELHANIGIKDSDFTCGLSMSHFR